MKRACVVLSAVLFASAFVALPASAKVDFDLGIKGGMSWAKVNFSGGGPLPEGEEFCNLKEPVYGFFLAINFNPTFAIQPEVYYLTQGGMYEKDVEGIFVYKLMINYIHVPVLAKVHLIKEGKLRPILFAGPAIGFLTAAKEKYYEDGELLGENDVKEYLTSTNFSAVFGGGLEFYMKKLFLVLDVRYDLGLTDIDRNEDPDDSTTIKTKSLMVMLGIGF